MYKTDLDRIIAKTILCCPENIVLDEMDKVALSKMICFQFTRVPAFVDRFIEKGTEYGQLLKKQITAIFENQLTDHIKEAINKAIEMDSVKDIILGGIIDEKRLQRYAELLSDRVWLVLYNKTHIPFYTSDNPVIMYNTQLDSFRYNDVGIGRYDTILYFPISSRVLIQILPASHTTDKIIDEYDCKRIILDDEELKFIISINKMQMHHASRDAYMDPNHLEEVLQMQDQQQL